MCVCVCRAGVHTCTLFMEPKSPYYLFMLQLSISVEVCSEYIFFLKVPGFLGFLGPLGLLFFSVCFGAKFELLWNFLRPWWSHFSPSRLG